MLEEGTKRTNRERAPRPYGRGARALGRGHARPDGHMPRFMRLRAACHEPQFIRSCAVVHAPARRLTCGRAAAPVIVRRLPLRLRAAALAGGWNETDKQGTRPRPYGRGRVLGRGCARSDGHMPRFMRLRAACHEPRFLRLRAVAHAGGRNETDKQGTRPRPYGRGRVFWDAGREHNRALTHTGKGARFGTGVAAGLFLRRGWDGAPGMAAGPSVFRGAAGGAAWRGVWLTGLCAAM